MPINQGTETPMIARPCLPSSEFTMKSHELGRWIAIGVAIGLGIGVAMHSIGVGLGVGAAIGVAIGRARNRETGPPQPPVV